MKLLIYADTPTCNTGFGIVSKNIIIQLLEQIPDIEIEVLGINETGEHSDLRRHPRLIIHPAFDGREAHGRFKLIKFLSEDRFDHILMIHDIITVTQALDPNGDGVASAIEKIKPFTKAKYHFYFPIDSIFEENKNYDWLRKLNAFDTLIPYTNFAKEQLAIAGIKTAEPMYHGVDTSIFYPKGRTERKRLKKELFDVKPDTKIISIIARNQWRKDIPASIAIFAEYNKKINSNSKLYIHSRLIDVGGNLKQYLDLHNLEEGKDYLTAKDLNPANGIDESSLNDIYNASDLLLSSARGEGFGLPYLEAMATKTLIMANNASIEEEILPTEYWHFYHSCSYVPSGQDGLPFPRLTVDDYWAVACQIQILFNKNPDELTGIKEKAYNRIKEDFDWNKEIQKLVKILQ
jgi:glycosyltransferase involved in cell wall biosynthesis